MASTQRVSHGRLPRTERREQILKSATEAFARGGYATIRLEDIAHEAQVTKVLLYRHFDSKADLYRAVLARARLNLSVAVGEPDYSDDIIETLVSAASRDPSGFRLLFHHSAREPDFQQEAIQYQTEMAATAYTQLTDAIPNPAWRQWAAHLAPTATTAAITAWLDAGQPDPNTAALRIRQAILGIVDAARSLPDTRNLGS